MTISKIGFRAHWLPIGCGGCRRRRELRTPAFNAAGGSGRGPGIRDLSEKMSERDELAVPHEAFPPAETPGKLRLSNSVPTSGSGQNEKPPFSGLCQLPPAADKSAQAYSECKQFEG